MFKRFLIALTLGVLLSVSLVSSASAGHIGFTINGQPNTQTYECVAPCTIQVYDPDGGSYQWDFEAQDGFDVQATGNPVSWTYQQPGLHTLTQFDGVSADGASVKVIPANESAPEDIALASPAQGTLPLVLEFTTTRKQIAYYCQSGQCEGEPAGRTGPDSAGRYHHVLRLDQTSPSFTLRVEAWNYSSNYAVEDRFAITTTGRKELYRPRPAAWKTRRKGGRCVVAFKQRFRTSYDYRARLTLSTRVGQRITKTIRKSGGAGRSRISGKLVLSSSQARKLPAKAKAQLRVTVAGKTYRTKDVRVVKAGCK